MGFNQMHYTPRIKCAKKLSDPALKPRGDNSSEKVRLLVNRAIIILSGNAGEDPYPEPLQLCPIRTTVTCLHWKKPNRRMRAVYVDKPIMG
jgi:hypothetical protein